MLLAWMYDLGTLLLALAVTGTVAVVWMLARTEWGRVDLRTGDAVIAVALALGVGPAWTAWQWLRLWDEDGTAGHARMRVAPLDRTARAQSSGRARRALWLALHPVSLPFWAWTTFICFVTGSSVFAAVAIVPLTATLLVGLLTAVSLVTLLVRPLAWPLHLWIARASFGGRR